MKWYKNLYVGKYAAKRKNKIKRKVNRGVGMVDTYLITLPSNSSNLLDILPSWSMKWAFIRKSCPMIIGIADGYEEAAYLVGTIVLDVYKKTGTFDIETYINSKTKAATKKD